MKKIFILLMMALATTCNISAKSNFVQVKDGHFVRDGKPYYYVGTNFGMVPFSVQKDRAATVSVSVGNSIR